MRGSLELILSEIQDTMWINHTTDVLSNNIFRVSIVVSISACHADDPGSIPGRGIYCQFEDNPVTTTSDMVK